jgi:Cu(I)-responsive transcriptional regulator
MNIGQASKASGVSAKMIRYYESIDLVPRSARRESGYRDYGAADIHRLGFIRRARDLGFSMDQIRNLLRLWGNEARSNADVKAIALEHVAELKQRAKALNEMAGALRHLAAACEGDGRPECPIIKGLEGRVPMAAHATVTAVLPSRTRGTELSGTRRMPSAFTRASGRAQEEAPSRA